MRNTCAYLLSVVWFSILALASANTWPEFGARWTDRDAVSQLWLERDSVIQTVADHRLGRRDRFRMNERGRSSSETKESRANAENGRERSRGSARSNNTPQSFSDVRDHPSNSVHSPSRRPDPWWGRRSGGDPMIKGLNRSPSGK